MAKAEKAPENGPSFAAGYPRDPELDRLVAAFSRGNHRLVRDEAEKVAAAATDPRVAAAARDLRRRLDPDPLAYVLLGATAALLLALTLWALKTSRANDHGRPPAATSSITTVQSVNK